MAQTLGEIAKHAPREQENRLADHFGWVTVALIATTLAFSLVETANLGAVLVLVAQLATFLLVLRAACVPPRFVRAGTIFSAVALMAVVAGWLLGGAWFMRVAFLVAMVAFAVVSPIAIGRRLLWHHTKIDGGTIFGAVAMYLYVGLFFAVVYSLVALIGGTPSLAATRPLLPADYVYFSYTTLTTVGYGDITGATMPVRMLAITEALVGQVYLVTVVALLVSNVGRERVRRGRPLVGAEPEEDSGTDD